MESVWDPGKPSPPQAVRYPIKLAYVRAYATDTVYIASPGHDEAPKSFRRRIYTTLHTMAKAATAVMDIRVIKLQPVFNWPQVW